MLRGHLLSIYVNFLGKKRTSVYISREKGDHYYIQTRHNDFFGYYNLFLGKLKEKFALKARINREGVYQIMLTCPMGILEYALNLIHSIWLPYQ